MQSQTRMAKKLKQDQEKLGLWTLQYNISCKLTQKTCLYPEASQRLLKQLSMIQTQ